MLVIMGFVVVIASVFGGFALAGGHLGPLFQPTELLMIGGAAAGAFVASNNGKAIMATVWAFRRLRPANAYNQQMYMELMSMLHALLSKARRDGMLGIEADIDNPQESELLSRFPRVLKDALIMDFITDYFRLMVAGTMESRELDELMLHEIEVFEHECEVPASALAKVADAMPAFGIVAAVMGVVKALSTADVGPDQMGEMIAHALVGTFLGILIGYGFISPLASRIEGQASEAVKVLQCIRVTLLASLHGYMPQIAVEFGRKAVFSAERPSFIELEDHVREQRPA